MKIEKLLSILAVSFFMCILLVVMIFGQSSTVTAQTVTEIRQELSQALQQSVQNQNAFDNLLAEADVVDKESDILRQQLQSDLMRSKGKYCTCGFYRSTGPHLYFEVRQDNQHIDPCIWLD
ncbi:MAG: hypothetical protein GX994_08910 [Firmicutes bacterium]|nr:hypothetical protein [Bacillota bacterium]